MSIYLLDLPWACRLFLAADGEVHVLLGCVDLLLLNIYVHDTCMHTYVCIYMWSFLDAGFGHTHTLSAHIHIHHVYTCNLLVEVRAIYLCKFLQGLVGCMSAVSV